MATKTITASQNVFNRTDFSSPTSRAIFTLDTDSSRMGLTQITLPEKSTWTPGPHWHEEYVEYFRVIKGRVLVKLGGVSRIVTPEDEVVRVDKFVLHEFMRADIDKSDDEKDPGEVITEEWTDPADGSKHVFFRNVFSTIQDSERYWGRWTFLQALYVMATYDNYIEIVPGRFSYLSTHASYLGIRFISRLVGLRPWCEEYTPESLRAIAAKKVSKSD